MDEWLAQVYGTGAPSQADLEKTAQSLMVEQLAKQEGIDLSQFSEEEIQALANEMIGGQQGQAQTAPAAAQEYTEEMAVKEAQAKFEEADFLGRVMAHSYTQELQKIASAQSKTKVAEDMPSGLLARLKGKGKDDEKEEEKKEMKEEKAEGEKTAFDRLAEQRALQILQENGIDPSTGQPVQQNTPEQQFNEALEKRAYQLLAHHGYLR